MVGKFLNTAIMVLGFICFASCITDLGEWIIVHFSDMQTGQESKYVRLHGFKYGDRSTNEYVQVADTLVVRVLGSDQSGFVLEDYLTAHSLRQLGEYDTMRFVYHVKISKGVLRVVGNSHLFWSGYTLAADAALPLPALNGKVYAVEGWKLGGDPHGDRNMGVAPTVWVGRRLYPQANVYYRHFEADGGDTLLSYYNGYCGITYIYSAEFGIIRSRYVGKPRFDEGLCWDLIYP
jgi:hypothetical protein